MSFAITYFNFKYFSDLSEDQWIGIETNGLVNCSSIQECDGQQIWLDGSKFDASIFKTITTMNIELGHT